MKYFRECEYCVAFFKEFLKRFFSESDDDKEAIDNVRSFFAAIDNVGMSGYDKNVQEAFDYVLNTSFEEYVLMDIMNEYSSREAYEDRDAERFFTMIYENLFLGKDEIYDYYGLTEEEDEDIERELEEIRREKQEELELAISWAEGRATKELISELNSSEVTMRRRSIIALRYRMDEGVDSQLLKRYKLENEISAQIYILESLVNMKSKAALELFLYIVRDRTQNSVLRTLAFSGLGELRDSRAISLLIELYYEDKEDWDVIPTLAKFKSEIVKLLMDEYLAGKSDGVLLNAVFCNIDERDDIVLLLFTYLESGDYNTMSTVLLYLMNTQNSNNRAEIVLSITPYLKSGNDKIRMLIVSNLKFYNCPESVEALTEALDDSNEDIRREAKGILALFNEKQRI